MNKHNEICIENERRAVLSVQDICKSESFKMLSLVLSHYCSTEQVQNNLHLLLQKAIVFSIKENNDLQEIESHFQMKIKLNRDAF